MLAPQVVLLVFEVLIKLQKIVNNSVVKNVDGFWPYYLTYLLLKYLYV